LEFAPESERSGLRFKARFFEDSRLMGEGSFESGRPASLEIPAPSFGRVHTYSALIDDGVRKPWRQRLSALNRFPISQSGSSFALENGVFSKGSVKGDFDRPKGSVSLSWTRDALLLEVATQDKWHVVAKSPEGMWNADSLQIGVAVPQSEMIHPNNDGIQETLYSMFGLMSAEGGVCPSWVWASSNRNLAELAAPLPGVKATWTREGERTVYKAEIPWRSLNVKNPRAGMELKFSLLVNDSDEGAQRHWLEWYGGIASGADLELYGDAVLTK
jgi:hypothetical protein